VRPKLFCQLKIPITPPEIEPATFRLVAQYLTQLRHRVTKTCVTIIIFVFGLSIFYGSDLELLAQILYMLT
jgi:hypothetical protein